MARFLTLTQNPTFAVGRRRRRTMKQPLRTGPVTLTVTTIVLIAIFSFLYLSVANVVATRGLDYSEYESNIAALKEKNRQLELKAAELGSLKNLHNAGASLKMVGISNVHYLEGVGQAVASK